MWMFPPALNRAVKTYGLAAVPLPVTAGTGSSGSYAPNPKTARSVRGAVLPVCCTAMLRPALAGAAAGGKNSPVELLPNTTCSWPWSLA